MDDSLAWQNLELDLRLKIVHSAQLPHELDFGGNQACLLARVISVLARTCQQAFDLEPATF